MSKTVIGEFRDGRVELAEAPAEVEDRTPVLVTFLEGSARDLRARGIDAARAAELRGKLRAFTEDWDSPEMEIYDDYEAARSHAR